MCTRPMTDYKGLFITVHFVSKPSHQRDQRRHMLGRLCLARVSERLRPQERAEVTVPNGRFPLPSAGSPAPASPT